MYLKWPQKSMHTLHSQLAWPLMCFTIDMCRACNMSTDFINTYTHILYILYTCCDGMGLLIIDCLYQLLIALCGCWYILGWFQKTTSNDIDDDLTNDKTFLGKEEEESLPTRHPTKAQRKKVKQIVFPMASHHLECFYQVGKEGEEKKRIWRENC